MKLYSIYNKEHKVLRDWFEGTLKDNFELHIIRIPTRSDHFRSNKFNTICLRKFLLLVEGIINNMGEVIISSDLDIQFFRPIKPLITKYMKKHDIVSQMNNYPMSSVDKRKPHIGFMAIRCNPITLQFFSALVQMMRDNPALQDMLCVNRLLMTKYKHLNLGYFPKTVWHPRYSTKPPKKIVLHHAIQHGEEGCFDKNIRLQLKLTQLKKIQDEINNIN